jgi:hypothetical protein
MSLAAEFTVPANAPRVFYSDADFRRWVPAKPRSAYRRRRGIQDSADWYNALARQEITLADVRKHVPQAFEDYQPIPGDDPVIRTWGDAWRNLTDKQIAAWLFYTDPTGRAKRTALEKALKDGTASYKRSEILRFNRYEASQGHYGGRFKFRAGDFATVETPRELGELNRKLVAKFTTGLIEEGEAQAERRKALLDMAVAFGAKPDAPVDGNLAAFVTAMIAETFTARGVAFDEAVEARRAQGDAFNADALTGAALDLPAIRAEVQTEQLSDAEAFARTVTGAQGIGDSFRKLIRHPLKWGRSVISQAGDGVADAAGFILDNAAKVGWLNNYIIKPTFIGAQLEVIRQLGNALAEGTISAFKEQAVAKNFAQGAQIAGTVALAVSQFLPVPWNIAVAATGAVLVAAGRAILSAQAATKASNEREEQIKELEQYQQQKAQERAQAEAELAELEQAANATRQAADLEPAENTPSSRMLVPIAAGIVGTLALAYVLTR